MKLRMILVLALTIIISFTLVSSQTKGDVVKKVSDKKSDCSMASMKSGSKDCCKKGEAASKDCCKKDGKMSENCSKGDKAKCDMSKDGKKAGCDMTKAGAKDCCKKDGKMSENCTHSEKEKCDKSKADMKDCPMGKSKSTEAKETDKKTD